MIRISEVVVTTAVIGGVSGSRRVILAVAWQLARVEVGKAIARLGVKPILAASPMMAWKIEAACDRPREGSILRTPLD